MKLKFTASLIIVTISNLIFIHSLFGKLKDPNNNADYIVISPAEFADELADFVNYKNARYINTTNIILDSIYVEFPDSLSETNSIKNFISYAIQYWQTPPKYCLLAGGINYIPSCQIITKFDSLIISFDEWFAVNNYDNDNRPDIALGRFPARNENELVNMINKTIQFEEYDSYKKQFLFVTDHDTLSGENNIFESVTESYIENLHLSEDSYTRIDLREESEYYGTEQDIFTRLNNNVLFFSYCGHGNPLVWSKYHIMQYHTIDSLLNNTQPFILTAVACNQNFDDPLQQSVVEKLISFDQKGAVAIICSSGLNYLTPGSVFLKSFHSNILGNPNSTIGEAFLQTKCELENENESEESVMKRFTLLGDPTLIIPFDNSTNLVINENTVAEQTLS